MKVKRTERGFSYIEYKDSRGCNVRIQKSSIATDNCVWIFCDDVNNVYCEGESSPHLTRSQARRVGNALIAFADGEWE